MPGCLAHARSPLEKVPQFPPVFSGEQLGDVAEFARIAAKQAAGGAVAAENRSRPGDRDDTARDAFEDRFRELVSLVEFPVHLLQVSTRLLERSAARRQLPGHFIKRADQNPQFIGRFGLDPVMKVAARDLVGGFGQRLDRNRNLPGKK